MARSVLVKTVKVSSKGQITLPKEVLGAVGADPGSEFILVQDEDRILLVRADQVGAGVVAELADWEAGALGSFAEVWNDPADEVWDDFVPPRRGAKRETHRAGPQPGPDA